MDPLYPLSALSSVSCWMYAIIVALRAKYRQDLALSQASSHLCVNTQSVRVFQFVLVRDSVTVGRKTKFM